VVTNALLMDVPCSLPARVTFFALAFSLIVFLAIRDYADGSTILEVYFLYLCDQFS